MFIATFVYAMVVQRAVRGTSAGSTGVPRIAVTVAFGFVLGSVALFIRYISHVANMIRVATIIDTIATESRLLLEQRYPAEQQAGAAATLPPLARTVPAPRAGVVVSVNERQLVSLADQHGCLLVLQLRVGDFVPAGAPLFAVHGEPADVDPLAVRACRSVALDAERTMEQDLAFGFRQLIDIAERALSPAVNDPTTACQVIDALHDLLRRLATRHDPQAQLPGPDGQPRLLVPRYDFADYLEITMAEIWRYGSDAAQVPARLISMLTDLEHAGLPEHRAAIQRWVQRTIEVG